MQQPTISDKISVSEMEQPTPSSVNGLKVTKNGKLERCLQFGEKVCAAKAVQQLEPFLPGVKERERDKTHH